MSSISCSRKTRCTRSKSTTDADQNDERRIARTPCHSRLARLPALASAIHPRRLPLVKELNASFFLLGPCTHKSRLVSSGWDNVPSVIVIER